jgi:N-methylhydantoinase A
MAFAAAGGIEWHETPVYDRGGLAPGHRFAGPALVTQDDSTTLVLPGQRVSVDACGNLVIVTVAGQGAAP